ncbi:Elongator complex protein 4 [Melampsora americana]|nr:Elongator complex protein 4 [Melampsora americana]
MSSFKKKIPSERTIPTGFYPSHYNGLPLTSTGIASLDDVLGGGIPASSSFLVAEDSDSSYSRLVLRYWITQGLAAGQRSLVIGSSLDDGGGPTALIDRLMDLTDNEKSVQVPIQDTGIDEEDDEESNLDDKSKQMKIAWRYESLGKHQAQTELHRRGQCHSFDLSKTMILSDEQRKGITCIDVADTPSYDVLLDQIDQILSAPAPSHPHPPLRIAIHSLGSPGSPAASHTILFKFLLRLKSLLQPSSSVAMITFPSTIYSAQVMPMLCWATDGCLALESFAGNDASQTAFPNHQGVCHFLRLPSPASLSPPSTKLSVLRGLGASDSAEAGGIDTNLGFKVGRRKGFRIEMMGLGIDAEPSRDDPTSHPQSESNVNHHPVLSEPIVESPKPKGKTKAKARVRFGGTDDLEEHASHKHPVKHLGNTDW